MQWGKSSVYEVIMKQRVVITGMGAISPLGTTVNDLWTGLAQGHSGIGPLTRFDTEGFSSRIAAQVTGFDPTDHM